MTARPFDSGQAIALRSLQIGLNSLGRLSPRLAGRWAYNLWFRTHRVPTPKRERQWEGKATQFTLDHEFGPLAIYSSGEGPAVLLVHGWNGRGTRMGAFAEPLMDAGFRAVSFDAPAHGKSLGRATTIFQIIEAAQRVVQEVGPLRGIITNSFGAMVMARALRTGMATARVVCISPPAHLSFLVESFCNALAIQAPTRTVFERLLEQRLGEDIGIQISAEVNAHGLSIPALIIHDKDDKEVPWQQGDRLARAWPQATFKVTQGLGHRRILTDPQTIEAAVTFIACRRGGGETSPPGSRQTGMPEDS